MTPAPFTDFEIACATYITLCTNPDLRIIDMQRAFKGIFHEAERSKAREVIADLIRRQYVSAGSISAIAGYGGN